MIFLLVKLEDGHGNFGSRCGLQCCFLYREMCLITVGLGFSVLAICPM